MPTTRLAIRRPAPRSSRRRLSVLAVVLLASLLTHASAGASSLGPGDSQLASGEYFDRITFQGNAGDAVLIEITSSAFDPYLIVLDQADNVLFQEDDSEGFGLNVRVEYRLPATGSYTVVVTSARPGEAGGYRLSLSAPDQAAAGPAKGVPAAGGTPPTQAPAQPSLGGAQGNAAQSPALPAPQPRTVTGTVVDTQGRPISGSRVWIQPALTTGLVEVRTDSQGRYVASSLIDVPYNAKAWAYVQYGGRQVCLRLGMESPVDYDAFVPTAGAVRNFRWQLTGPIEDLRSLNEYFGGMLRVMNTNAYGGRGRLEFTFTPTGPRIDGSAVAPFIRTIDPAREYDIYDLPVGPYRVTAALVGADGSRQPVRLGPGIFDTGLDAIDIDWTGDGTCSNSNGLGWAYVWLNVPE